VCVCVCVGRGAYNEIRANDFPCFESVSLGFGTKTEKKFEKHN